MLPVETSRTGARHEQLAGAVQAIQRDDNRARPFDPLWGELLPAGHRGLGPGCGVALDPTFTQADTDDIVAAIRKSLSAVARA